jgi:hypothetical protein
MAFLDPRRIHHFDRLKYETRLMDHLSNRLLCVASRRDSVRLSSTAFHPALSLFTSGDMHQCAEANLECLNAMVP